MHPRLLHFHRTDAGENRALRHVAIADDLAVALGIAARGVFLDPGLDLRLDGLSDDPLGAVTDDLGEHILTARQWHDARIAGRTLHGGVLLWPRGASWEKPSADLSQGTPPFFIRLSTRFGHSSGCS